MDSIDNDLYYYFKEEEETCPECGECILEEYYSCTCEDEEEEE